MLEPERGPQEPFLTRLTAEELAALRARGVARHFERGATIVHQGEVPGRVVVIERGYAKVTAMTEDGKEVVLAFRGPGDVVGELAALTALPRSATVRTIEPIDALAVAVGDFEAWLEQHPRVALELLKVVIARLREADRQQFEFAAYQTLGRIARRLVELAERFGEPCEDGVRISLRISQEELAGWAGASREATSKALHDLRQIGLIETQRRRLTVRSVEGLRGLTA
ncbi:MAG TPA: Crp/Fnr family transcriptional regulator [Thermoleophilaceae bacterium]|jgi:CRP-like cAMP-binding protein|nr:Crp/Fnr family transcriptional regulator [Thermoleophilaceae bacterium]